MPGDKNLYATANGKLTFKTILVPAMAKITKSITSYANRIFKGVFHLSFAADVVVTRLWLHMYENRINLTC